MNIEFYKYFYIPETVYYLINYKNKIEILIGHNIKLLIIYIKI